MILLMRYFIYVLPYSECYNFMEFLWFLIIPELMGSIHDAIFKFIHSHVLLESILDKRVPLHCTDVLK